MNPFSLSLNQTAVPTAFHSPFQNGHIHRGHHHDISNTPAATSGTGGNGLPSNASVSGDGGTQSLTSADKLSSSLAGLNAAIAQLRTQLDSLLGIGGSNGVTDTTAPDAVPTTSGTVGALDMGAHFISKQRGELTITTQEGDVVTLKFSNKVSVDYASHQASDGTTSVTAESLSVRSRSRIGISVEGDLNDKELAAINDLVSKVGKLTDEFYNGNVDQALNAAGDLSFDTSQLSDASLNLSLRQRFYAHGTAILATPVMPSPSTSSTSTSAPATSVQASPVLPAVDPSAAEQVAAAIDQAGSAGKSQPQIADQPASQINQSASDTADAPTSTAGTPVAASPSEPSSPPATQTPASATQVLAGFVAKVKESLHVSSTDSSLGFSYDFKVRLLLSAIVINQPPAPVASPVTSPSSTSVDSSPVSAA